MVAFWDVMAGKKKAVFIWSFVIIDARIISKYFKWGHECMICWTRGVEMFKVSASRSSFVSSWHFGAPLISALFADSEIL